MHILNLILLVSSLNAWSSQIAIIFNGGAIDDEGEVFVDQESVITKALRSDPKISYQLLSSQDNTTTRPTATNLSKAFDRQSADVDQLTLFLIGHANIYPADVKSKQGKAIDPQRFPTVDLSDQVSSTGLGSPWNPLGHFVIESDQEKRRDFKGAVGTGNLRAMLLSFHKSHPQATVTIVEGNCFGAAVTNSLNDFDFVQTFSGSQASAFAFTEHPMVNKVQQNSDFVHHYVTALQKGLSFGDAFDLALFQNLKESRETAPGHGFDGSDLALPRSQMQEYLRAWCKDPKSHVACSGCSSKEVLDRAMRPTLLARQVVEKSGASNLCSQRAALDQSFGEYKKMNVAMIEHLRSQIEATTLTDAQIDRAIAAIKDARNRPVQLGWYDVLDDELKTLTEIKNGPSNKRAKLIQDFRHQALSQLDDLQKDCYSTSDERWRSFPGHCYANPLNRIFWPLTAVFNPSEVPSGEPKSSCPVPAWVKPTLVSPDDLAKQIECLNHDVQATLPTKLSLLSRNVLTYCETWQKTLNWLKDDQKCADRFAQEASADNWRHLKKLEAMSRMVPIAKPKPEGHDRDERANGTP